MKLVANTYTMNSLLDNFQKTRNLTTTLVQNLEPEDTVVQPVEFVSPPKWHLAHTTWFFENFILKKFKKNFKVYVPEYDFLFNSYYESQGQRTPRNTRGYYTRPLLREILEYRKYVDSEMCFLLENDFREELANLTIVGINHEEQHQELLLTDLKYIWSFSPFYPKLVEKKPKEGIRQASRVWLPIDRGLYTVGTQKEEFHFDNESPEHRVYLDSFEIASTPITNGEYLEFIADEGYRRFELWLQEGFNFIQQNKIESPLYWKKVDDEYYVYTLSGYRKLNGDEPVSHISYYEAEAFARWKNQRLPTEFEWEVAVASHNMGNADCNFLDSGELHPRPVIEGENSFLGQVWEWTQSSYLPYPGFKAWSGGLGEYNGKFMINQMVLRGGSCVTPKKHIRTTYRNFFHPESRWQFSGIRLARGSSTK